MRKFKIKSIIFRILVVVLAVIFVFISPLLSLWIGGDDHTFIYGTFLGKKSEYQGMIEIWNIDTFESGTASKVSYIKDLAKNFQKENKGTYIIVRNLTESECLNLLQTGEKPSLISCSYGVVEKIGEYIKSFKKNDIEINQKFLNAGKDENDIIYAVPWCIGMYTLITTKSKLEKCNISNDNLNELVYSLGYEYKIGKKIKKSKSITYGTGNYLMPKNALIAYNKARSIQLQEIENEELNLKSQYSAYCSFLANDATVLLGTQRDIYRMENREKQGKINDVIYLPLNKWTDLVQFVAVCKTDNEKQGEYAEKFALYLIKKENQERLSKIGMLPVVDNLKTEYESNVMCNIVLDNFSNLELKSIF